jgi:CheY-like chemotaxis protein
VEYIHSSSENLLTLINDILDLSKIEAGKMNIDEAPFSLNGLISSVQIMFSDKARQKGLKFRIQVDPAIQDVLCGDAVRLTQILINLLSNAIKFTDKGSVQLTVSPVKQTAEDVELEFSVKDTGMGIAPEKRALIFERFHQADAQTTRRYGGTGLGLSIVKQLVDLQNGIIQVRSEVGQGTEFVVRLPFKTVGEYELSDMVAREEVESTIRDVKVLIAEDNAMNQQLMRHLMKQWNVDYKLVSNGREALQALEEEAFSLILMDIQMPEMDGYNTTLAIRNELKLDTPIVAMTAHAMAGEKERCISYGMNDYISKPVKEGELFSILRLHAKEATEAPNGTQVIDLAYLKELSFGDPEFENAIIRQFIVQVPDELKLLQEAIQHRDYPLIKSLAHGMKSSVAYLGLSEQLFPPLQRMEEEAVTNNENGHYEEDFSTVQETCDQAVKEARQLIQVSV